MLFDALMTPIFLFIYAIFALFPQLPETPQALISVKTWLEGAVESSISILAFWYEPTFLITVIGLVVVFLFFDQLYYGIMFILKKIPFLDIH